MRILEVNTTCFSCILSLTPFRSFFVREIGTCDAIVHGHRRLWRHKPRFPRERHSLEPAREKEREPRTLYYQPTHEHTYLTPDQITSRSFSKAHCLFDNLFHWTFIFGIRRPTFAKTMETLMFDMLSDCFLLPKKIKIADEGRGVLSWTYIENKFLRITSLCKRSDCILNQPICML